MRKRVALFSHSSEFYGAERCLYRLIKGLDRGRFDPIVYLPGSGPLESALRALDIPIEVVEMERWITVTEGDRRRGPLFLDGLSRRAQHLADLLCKRRVELVVINSSVVADAAVAAALRGVPFIWWLHEMLGRQPGLKPVLSPTEFLKRFDGSLLRLVAVSRAVKHAWSNFIEADRIQVIHNGIAPVSVPVPADRLALGDFAPADPMVTFVGTLALNKGPAYLIGVAELVRQAIPQVKFVIVGPDAGELDSLRDRIKETGVDDAFAFLGFRSDVPEILACSDLFVLPSIADSFPTVLLEAMQAGLAVVATRSGGAEEIVVDGETGLLVEVGDTAAMAAEIVRCLLHPEERERMGKLGQRRVAEHFDEAMFQSSFTTLLEESLAQGFGSMSD